MSYTYSQQVFTHITDCADYPSNIFCDNVTLIFVF